MDRQRELRDREAPKEVGDVVRYIDDTNTEREAIAWTRQANKEGTIDVVPLDTLIAAIVTTRILPVGITPVSVPSYRVAGGPPYWAE